MSHQVTISSQFNGPLESGNGGYSAGLLASFLDEPVEVTLRNPIPLERPLEVVGRDDGSIELLADGQAVAEAREVGNLEIEVPEPVSVNEARRAMPSYRGTTDGEFCRCFVCGKAREDSFGVFAGRVEGRDMVASTWVPPTWAEGETGHVSPELIWAALDCPAYFSTHIEGELTTAMLARMTGRVAAPVATGVEYVVAAWPIEIDGRKQHAGSALFSADGEVLAAARALMIEPRQG
jgi:hypothetical protein